MDRQIDSSSHKSCFLRNQTESKLEMLKKKNLLACALWLTDLFFLLLLPWVRCYCVLHNIIVPKRVSAKR